MSPAGFVDSPPAPSPTAPVPGPATPWSGRLTAIEMRAVRRSVLAPATKKRKNIPNCRSFFRCGFGVPRQIRIPRDFVFALAPATKKKKKEPHPALRDSRQLSRSRSTFACFPWHTRQGITLRGRADTRNRPTENNTKYFTRTKKSSRAQHTTLNPKTRRKTTNTQLKSGRL